MDGQYVDAGLTWYTCGQVRRVQLWAETLAGKDVAVVDFWLPGQPKLRAWYRSPLSFEPLWPVQLLHSGEHQRHTTHWWDTLVDGQEHRIEYGHCGRKTSSPNSRWEPGRVLAYLTWRPPPSCPGLTPGVVLNLAPGAARLRGRAALKAKRLALEVA